MSDVTKSRAGKCVTHFHACDCREYEFAQLRRRVSELTEQKDGAYSERNKLVAHLSKVYPSGLARHDENDKTWDDDWRWIVVIDSPEGQLTWHIHDSEFPMFAHLQPLENYVWDGHTTEEKYQRLKDCPSVEKRIQQIDSALTAACEFLDGKEMCPHFRCQRKPSDCQDCWREYFLQGEGGTK